MKHIANFFLWIGLINLDSRTGKVKLPFHAPPWFIFKYHLKCDRKPYRFRNLPGVIKWIPGRLLPMRWGGGWLGFEIGDRGHSNQKQRL